MPITINGTGTVAGLSVGGVNDGAIAHADLATSTQPIFSSYAIICDRKDSTTDGGSFSTGAWRTRDLNHEIADPDSIVSISSNQFTLQAGTYLIKWKAPVYSVDRFTSRLYDITNSALKEYGTSGFDNNNAVQTASEGFARVTISGSTAYEIQCACQTTDSNGFGVASETNAAGAHSSGTTEGYSIYTVVEIYKEAS